MNLPDSESQPTISELLQKCQELCGNVDPASQDLSGDRESFLRGSLGDALQQLELILRVLDGESKTATREESQGILRRIFARKPEEEGGQAPAVGSPRQGLQGNSWTISLSELLGFLAYGRKAGVLWVDTLEENYMLVLEEGRLLHATSDRTPAGLRLGETLVGFGFLTRRQLERFLARREDGQKLIAGQDLIEAGMISDDELLSALAYQVQQLFYRLVTTKNAVFRFREGMEVALAHKVTLDINQLLLQTAAIQDETTEHVSAGNVLDELSELDGWADGDPSVPEGSSTSSTGAAQASTEQSASPDVEETESKSESDGAKASQEKTSESSQAEKPADNSAESTGEEQGESASKGEKASQGSGKRRGRRRSTKR